jgi:hypothetical protein
MTELPPVPKKQTKPKDVAVIGIALTIGSLLGYSAAAENPVAFALAPFALLAGVALLIAAFAMWIIKVGVSSAR